MIEELDLVTHLLQWRDANRWRLVSKDESAVDGGGGMLSDDVGWATAGAISGMVSRGDHYLFGRVNNGMPSAITVNGGVEISILTVGRLWAATSEEPIREYDVMYAEGGNDRMRSAIRIGGRHPDCAQVDTSELLHDQPALRWQQPGSPDTGRAWERIRATPLGEILAAPYRDLHADHPGLLDIGVARGGLMLWEPDGSGVGVNEWLDLMDKADVMVEVSDGVQKAAIDALWARRRKPTWPQCPDHPTTHPLIARVVDGEATWLCPASERAVAAVGRLYG